MPRPHTVSGDDQANLDRLSGGLAAWQSIDRPAEYCPVCGYAANGVGQISHPVLLFTCVTVANSRTCQDPPVLLPFLIPVLFELCRINLVMAPLPPNIVTARTNGNGGRMANGMGMLARALGHASTFVS